MSALYFWTPLVEPLLLVCSKSDFEKLDFWAVSNSTLFLFRSAASEALMPLVGIWEPAQDLIEIIPSRKNTPTLKETQYLTWFGLNAYVHGRVAGYHYNNGDITERLQ